MTHDQPKVGGGIGRYLALGNFAGGFSFLEVSMKPEWEWHRVPNDTNGNSRFAVHFLPLVRDQQGKGWGVDSLYRLACKRANQLGGRKYHTKTFGGGVVFQAYESQLAQLERDLLALCERSEA